MKLSLRLIKFKPLLYKLVTFLLMCFGMYTYICLGQVLIKSILTLTLISVFSAIALVLLAIITSVLLFAILIAYSKTMNEYKKIHEEQVEVSS